MGVDSWVASLTLVRARKPCHLNVKRLSLPCMRPEENRKARKATEDYRDLTCPYEPLDQRYIVASVRKLILSMCFESI
jgi:hypothetical protein